MVFSKAVNGTHRKRRRSAELLAAALHNGSCGSHPHTLNKHIRFDDTGDIVEAVDNGAQPEPRSSIGPPFDEGRKLRPRPADKHKKSRRARDSDCDDDEDDYRPSNGDKSESEEDRNARMRLRQRRRRSKETAEQRERRLRSVRERAKVRRQSETPEESRARLDKVAARMRLVRECETEEQRALRRQGIRERVSKCRQKRAADRSRQKQNGDGPSPKRRRTKGRSKSLCDSDSEPQDDEEAADYIRKTERWLKEVGMYESSVTDGTSNTFDGREDGSYDQNSSSEPMFPENGHNDDKHEDELIEQDQEHSVDAVEDSEDQYSVLEPEITLVESDASEPLRLESEEY